MKYISMLRGINVSGQKKIVMTDLKKLYEKCGFEGVETYIQSGNVIFSSAEKNAEAVAGQIESAIRRKYSFDVEVVIRTAGELGSILRSNPFSGEKVYFTFFRTIPEKAPSEKIDKVKRDGEEIRFKRDVAYFNCPDGYGTTKLSNGFLEKICGTAATTRNLKTIRKLVAMAEG